MKKHNFFFLFVFVFLQYSVMAQSKAVDKFVKQLKNSKHLKGTDYHSFKIGGWLIRTGLAFTDQPEADIIRPLARSLDRLHIVVVENTEMPNNESLQLLATDLQEEKFENLMQIRDKDSRVSVFSRDNKQGDVINDLVFIIKDETNKDFVLLSLEGDFKLSDIQKALEKGRKVNNE